MFEAKHSESGALENGTWIMYKASHEIMFKCPKGHIGLLDHEIDRKGIVTPSVQCPEEGCDFHDMVKLLDWSKENTLGWKERNS